MSDLINRADAIKALKSNYDLLERATLRTDKARRDEISAMMAKIMSLPSAEPKTGEWINRSLNIRYPEWERYTCSECGKHSYSYDYCPNCGARMKGADDEADNN